MAKLGEVCDILNGYAFKSNQYTTSGVRIIRISNVQKGYIEDKSPVYYPCDDENVKKYELKQNDLLISLTGNVGRTALLEEKFLPAALNQRVSCVRLKEPDKVLKTYLFHLLNSDYFEQQCMKAAEGVAQKNLSPKWLFEYKIPIYSIERQKEISNTLDKIDLLIILRKQQLAKLDELVKARFVEMFGDCKTNPKNWKTKALEKIANVGSSKRVFVEELQDSGIPFYRGTEIGALAEKKAVIPALFITEEHYKQLCETTGKPQKGDLLMPSICPDGRIWIVDTDEPFYFKDGRVLWVHLTSANYNSVFLLYTLKDRIMTDYASIASGTTFAELKIFALKKCKVFDVPLELQNQFATFIERVDRQKQTVQQSLEKLELMKKALMQEYFG